MSSKYAQKPPQELHGQDKKMDEVIPSPLASETVIAPLSQPPPLLQEKENGTTHDIL